MIDLRSDTFTRPSDDMRRAMAQAEVGDDVFGADPTVNALEARTAELLGTEAAMYVPTGTMSNQIAVKVNTRPGDTVVVESSAHVASHELGGASVHSGVTFARIDGILGVITPEQLADTVPTRHPSLPGHLYDPHTLLCIENTHMEAGGTVWTLDQTIAVTDMARSKSMAVHLDGARIWNAWVASGTSPDLYASTADTISVCFSKGLGAPIGSAFAASAEIVAEARRYKHMFGGGFRQAGVIAAGALFALDHNIERLQEDHDNARRFATAIAETSRATTDLDTLHTNLVYFYAPDAGRIVEECEANGVAMLAFGPTRVRAVFHLDVSDDDTTKAIDVVTRVIDKGR